MVPACFILLIKILTYQKLKRRLRLVLLQNLLKCWLLYSCLMQWITSDGSFGIRFISVS